MSFLWEAVKVTGKIAGNVALVTGQKTKLRGELMLADRDINSRKQAFGVELYDFVAPLASSPDFFAASDKMTETIRGPVLAAQREIAALLIKRGKLKEKLAQAEVTRKAAFPTAAANYGEMALNAGKAAGFAANETKIATEISMVDTQITAHKQDFGMAMFDVFVKLEDEEGWLPTVRDIRSMYDQARRDVEKLKGKKTAKEKELQDLGGGSLTPDRQSPIPPPTDTSAVNVPGLYNSSRASAAPAANGSVFSSSSSAYGATTQPVSSSVAPTSGYSAPASGYSAPAVARPSPAPVSAPAPAAYVDPFSASSQPQQFAATSTPAYDPFSFSQQQQQPAAYDPFSAQPTALPAAFDPFSAQPAAPRQNGSNDPFAGL